MSRVARLGFAAALASAVAPASSAWAQPAGPVAPAAAPTVEYVVKPGDTCLGIAVRILGDRGAYDEIHRLNPGLGPLPHILAPGRILRLPRRADSPDARLTGTSGDVRFRKPTEEAWDAAKRGMDLFRAWRVSAGERASAEVTFSDTKRMFLREQTIVIIYGPKIGRARVTVNEATLESGTLRTRLNELSGGGEVTVTTPTAVASLSGGSALVSVAGDGVSTVANHRGKPVDLRGRTSGRVAVAPGMGSRVRAGRPPDRPRKLPRAPAWAADAGATGFPSVAGAGASMRAAWSPVAGASAYRVEIDAPSGVTVFSVEVPATITNVEVHGAPPGRYRARVATVDAERFEGRPAPELELVVIDVAVSTPGGPTAAATALADEDPPLTATAGSPAIVARVALGSAIGDGALTCMTTGASSAPLVLATAGPTTIACTTADGRTVAPFAVDVVPVTAAISSGARTVAVTRGSHEEIAITIASDVALGNGWRVEPGPGLTCEGFASVEHGVTIRVGVDDGAPATSTLDVIDDRTGTRIATLPVLIGDVRSPDITRPTRPTRPRRAATGRTQIAAGAFAGWTAFPSGMRDGLELGDAPVSAYQVDSGAGAGMRAAFWLQRDLFVELEAGLWPTGFVAADEPASITSGHALLGYQMVERRRLAARAVVGAGGYALLGDATYARADVDPAISWGLTGALRLNRELSVRVDGRHRIAPDRADAGATDVFEATIGIEAVLTRTPAPR